MIDASIHIVQRDVSEMWKEAAVTVQFPPSLKLSFVYVHWRAILLNFKNSTGSFDCKIQIQKQNHLTKELTREQEHQIERVMEIYTR